MEINVKENVLINNVLLNSVSSVEVTENKVKFGRPHFYNMGECDCKDIQTMEIDNRSIIKNGKILVECLNCDDCPMCKQVEFEIYITPHTFRRMGGYFCGKNKVYSETIEDLKTSKQRSKQYIELKNSYKLIEDEFKYRRQKYITDETIKKVIKDIEQCMTPSTEMAAIDEYGNKRIEMESMRIYKNSFGFTVSHYGRMGDYGWSSKIYIHKRCDVSKLSSVLRSIASKNRCKFENEL